MYCEPDSAPNAAPQAAALDRTVGMFDQTPLSDRTVNVFAPPSPKPEPAQEREPKLRPQPVAQDSLPPVRHVTFDEPPAPRRAHRWADGSYPPLFLELREL